MIEVIQIVLAVSMLLVATVSDLRSRSINDLIWIIFGSMGIILTIIAIVDNPDLIWNLIATGICIGASLFVWITKCFGMADMLGIIMLSIILPQLEHVPLIPILVLSIASVLCFLYVVMLNVGYNMKDVFTINLFKDVDESSIKKIIAFFLIHKKRQYELFIFPSVIIVDGQKKFMFNHNPDAQIYAQKDTYVSSTVPMMPFFLISLLFIIFFYVL